MFCHHGNANGKRALGQPRGFCHGWRMNARSLMVAALCLAAAPATARAPSLPPPDAPELAAAGNLPVGVRSARFEAGEGRELGITLWYPAKKAGKPTHYTHRFDSPPPGIPPTLTFEGIATANSAAASGPRLPLVLLSPGFGRWATAMSGIAENLASKGYVVASIDHDDGPAMDPARRAERFAIAFVHRGLDQRAAISFLSKLASGTDPVGKRIDAGNIAVIGYSMGGYGALSTAGAGHDRNGPLMAKLPTDEMSPILEGATAAPGVRAVVLIAPWGGQPQVRSFTEKSIAGMALPSLWIMGDADDVAGADGIRWLHDHAIASDRRLLVFANARHNLGGNPPPDTARDSARLRDALDEPVWRKDMADAIVLRSLTAFLDLELKADAGKARWLDPQPDGTMKGFMPRWQLGFSTTHTPPPAR